MNTAILTTEISCYSQSAHMRKLAAYSLAGLVAALWLLALGLAALCVGLVAAWDNRKIVLGLPLAALVVGTYVWWLFNHV